MNFEQIANLIDNSEKAQHVANFYNSVDCKILCLSDAHKTAEVSIGLDFDAEVVLFARNVNGTIEVQDVTEVIGQQLSLSHDILEAPKPERKRRTRKIKQ